MDTTIFVGLDVHKKTIAVATVEGRAAADLRYFGTIPNTPDLRGISDGATTSQRWPSPVDSR